MQIIEGVQGGDALAISPEEYLVASTAITVELARTPAAGPYAYESTDSHFHPYAIDGEGLNLPTPQSADSIAAAKRLAHVLENASSLYRCKQMNEPLAEMRNAQLPAAEREVITAAELTVATASDAARLNIEAAAMELAAQDRLVISPEVTPFVLKGLEAIVSTHGLWGALKSAANQTRHIVGIYAPDKPFPLPRVPRSARKAAKAAVQSL